MVAADSTDIVSALTGDHRSIEEQMGAVVAAERAGRDGPFRELVAMLVRHEVAEEEVVYPALRDVPGAEAVAAARIAEQAEVESRLAELERLGSDTAEFDSTFSQLQRSVREHAALEAEQVFPLLEEMAGPTRSRLGGRYHSEAASAPTHPHPSAPDRPPGNRLVGPIASLFGRLRDRGHRG